MLYFFSGLGAKFKKKLRFRFDYGSPLFFYFQISSSSTGTFWFDVSVLDIYMIYKLYIYLYRTSCIRMVNILSIVILSLSTHPIVDLFASVEKILYPLPSRNFPSDFYSPLFFILF